MNFPTSCRCIWTLMMIRMNNTDDERLRRIHRVSCRTNDAECS